MIPGRNLSVSCQTTSSQWQKVKRATLCVVSVTIWMQLTLSTLYRASFLCWNNEPFPKEIPKSLRGDQPWWIDPAHQCDQRSHGTILERGISYVCMTILLSIISDNINVASARFGTKFSIISLSVKQEIRLCKDQVVGHINMQLGALLDACSNDRMYNDDNGINVYLISFSSCFS